MDNELSTARRAYEQRAQHITRLVMRNARPLLERIHEQRQREVERALTTHPNATVTE